MRGVVQRVRHAGVAVDGATVGWIGPGILLFLGVAQEDDDKDLAYMVDKVLNLRIFEDDQGKMNRSLLEVGGELLVVSQFTLLGDCRKGRRPSFTPSAPPEQAETMYEKFIEQAKDQGVKTESGRFGAMMEVELLNDGPVTLLLDSRRAF